MKHTDEKKKVDLLQREIRYCNPVHGNKYIPKKIWESAKLSCVF